MNDFMYEQVQVKENLYKTWMFYSLLNMLMYDNANGITCMYHDGV